MRSALAAIVAVLSAGAAAAQGPAPPSRDRPAGVLHNVRLKVGMPLGGIGAGSIRLLTDAEFSRANTGDPLPGCFAAVRAGSRACVLAQHNAFGLPCPPRIDFKGLFPTATVTPFGADLPLDVSLEAFSPFVVGDLRDSSEPGAVVVITMRNPSQHAVPAAALLSWQGMPAPGGSGGSPLVSALPITNNVYALRISSSAAGFGETTVASEAIGPDTVVSRTAWKPRPGPPAWWAAFSRSGSLPPKPGSGPNCAVAVSVSVAAGATVRIPFAVTWFAPDATAAAGGRYYANWATSSTYVARNLLQDWRSLRVLTDEWHFALMTSDLPPWLARAVINSLVGMVTQTRLARSGAFAWRQEKDADTASPSAILARAVTLLTLFPQLEANRITIDAARLTGAGGTRIALLAVRLALYQSWTGDQTLAQQTASALVGAALAAPAAAPGDAAGCGIQLCGWRALARILAQSGNTTTAQALLNRAAPLMAQYASSLQSQSPPPAPGSLLGVWAGRLLHLPPLAPPRIVLKVQAPGNVASSDDAHIAELAMCCGDLAIRTGNARSGLKLLGAIDAGIWSGDGGPFDIQQMGLFWPALSALEGAGIRLSTGELNCVPSIPGSWRELNAPIFLPTLVGWMRFRPYAHGERFSLRVDRLVAPPTLGPARRLLLATLRIPAPLANRQAQEDEVHVLLNRNPVPTSSSLLAGDIMLISFKPALTLNAGDLVQVTIH